MKGIKGTDGKSAIALEESVICSRWELRRVIVAVYGALSCE
jgi:hypothetical protein